MPLDMTLRLRRSWSWLVVLAASAACSSPSIGAVGAPIYDADDTEDPSCAFTLTSYEGDCQVPKAVDPSVGVTAHYGPRDYDDPDDVARYVMPPDYEAVDCVYSALPNATDSYYQSYDVVSRPGTHHVILSALKSGTSATDGAHDDCQMREGAALLAVVQGEIGGTPYHYPPADDVAPENLGLATKLATHQMIAYELHAINATAHPLLRENWTTFHLMPADQVKATVGQMAFNGGLSMQIPAHTKQTITNSCTVPSSLGKIRLVDLFGHMHAHGTRFTAWVNRGGASAARELIYESYDWSELDLIQFNSAKENPVIRYLGGTPGGASGVLLLEPNDRIEYECAIDNTTDATLTFAAKAFSGEMCNMFGSFTPGTYWSCLGE